jgi:hypothetical protein
MYKIPLKASHLQLTNLLFSSLFQEVLFFLHRETVKMMPYLLYVKSNCTNAYILGTLTHNEDDITFLSQHDSCSNWNYLYIISWTQVGCTNLLLFFMCIILAIMIKFSKITHRRALCKKNKQIIKNCRKFKSNILFQ